MRQILTSVFCFILFYPHAQITDIKNWKTQTDLQFFSTMQYPPGWTAEDIRTGGYIITSPLESDTDQYRENITLLALEAPDSVMAIDIKKIAEANFTETKKIVQDTKLIAYKYITINGLPMYLIGFNGAANGQYLYFKQLFCLYKNAAYIITYTGQAGKEESYATVSDDMFYSFRPGSNKKE